jgi:hypothetical protein
MSCGLNDDICNCHFSFDRISYAFNGVGGDGDCGDDDSISSNIHVSSSSPLISYTHHEYDDDFNNNKYDLRIDFYYHLENVLLNKTSFNDEILNINLSRINVEKSSEKILLRIFDLMRKNFSLSTMKKIQIIKSLLCWQCQFNDLNLVKKIIQFAQNYFQHNEIKNVNEILNSIGDYETSSKQSNTLYYAIHSGSIDILQFMIEKYGTKLAYATSSTQRNEAQNQRSLFNPLSYSIIVNKLNVLEYLLTKIQKDCKKIYSKI